MEVYRSLESYRPGAHSVATIGTFDGLHIGHRTILERICQTAKEIDGESVLISFHPHPRLVLFPENNPLRLLHTLDEKIQMLDEIGIDKLLLIPFTREFSRIPSKVFIREILVETVKIDKIIIGYDHRFGKNRTGGIEELNRYKDAYQYEVEEISAQAIDDANVSSTKIRKALESGDVATANSYLGYTYSFGGTVIHGEKMGRKLGYPTANIQPHDPLKLIPANGVYLVQVEVDGGMHYGMLNIGNKPTVGEFERGYEVNILDFDQDIYDQPIRVKFLEYLRPEAKFDNLDQLIAAMHDDKAKSLAKIAELENQQ
ncbi:bifunctional riboflavin kinase/FAD synthetase [Pontibacter sp. G13]|uniref:bifunctional riboflavin kinase/FAD synthetase n=1 Tax=Pontibacter sp. G13 TaxID=3074898 RepID=UPI00288B0F38|nr:bifunctional riboflavin kinase/FAD synthetase [Pontibacter sp. G13]WNJ20422.1 bifunctional riboflavin kinase/FAD synthetase [Pontibacter sp. G13]